MRFRENDLLRWVWHNLIPTPKNGWKLFSKGQLLYLEYGIQPRPRYGHGQPVHPELYAILNRGREDYARRIQSFKPYLPNLRQVDRQRFEVAAPTFRSNYYSGMDAIVLYSLIRQQKPRRFVEIGSGNSTHFARLAAHDAGIDTHITCVDALPSADIQRVADTVIEKYLDQVALDLVTDLDAGDIFFMEGSHRSFTNSDVTIFFLEILPRLKPGVLVHLHDIFLPSDYPPRWNRRYYSEQYLLAAYLLAETQRFEVLFPVQFVVQDAELSELVRRTWTQAHAEELLKIGVAFWLVTK